MAFDEHMLGVVFYVFGIIVILMGIIYVGTLSPHLPSAQQDCVCSTSGIVGIVLIAIGIWFSKKSIHDLSQKIKIEKEDNIKPTSPREDADEVLKLRYAKGEITKEEFEEMKKDLKD